MDSDQSPMPAFNSFPPNTGYKRIQKFSIEKSYQGDEEARETDKTIYSRKRIILLSNGRIRILEILSLRYSISQDRDP